LPFEESLQKPAPKDIVFKPTDLLGVAKILGQLRGDVTYPGDPGGK